MDLCGSNRYLKAPAAEVARERLVPGVLSAVSDQIGGLTERFATHDALMRLFP